MAHLILEYDADPHFSIDPDTQELAYESEEELTFIKGDHNSKRLTFELPRYIDWHDISLCNKVRVHFTNINAEDPQLRVEDTYDVDDLRLCPDDEENTVVFSWLVSKRATTHVGTLNFIVSFLVIDENSKEIEYSWNTGIYADIPIRDGYDHGEFIAVKYADILEEWHQKLIDDSTSGVNEILRAQNEALDMLEAMKEDVIANVGDKNTEVLGIIDEAKNQAVTELEQETQDLIDVIAEYGGIAVSETEPTNDKIDFWIQDLPVEQQESVEIPEMSDIENEIGERLGDINTRLSTVENKLENFNGSTSQQWEDITDKKYANEHGVTYRIVFSEEYRARPEYQALLYNADDFGQSQGTPEGVDIYMFVSETYSDGSGGTNWYEYLHVTPNENGVLEFECRQDNPLKWTEMQWIDLYGEFKVYKLVESESGNVSVDLSNYYTKPEIDTKIGDIDAALDHIIEIQNELIIPDGDEVEY